MGIWGVAHYDTVKDYVTYGKHIVMAHHQPDSGLALTGLVVDVPDQAIPDLDALEAGYKRITIDTVQGEQVQMYVA